MFWAFRQKVGAFIMDPRRVLRSTPEPAVPEGPDLSGDRDVEWGYVMTRLGQHLTPGANVLDFGCGPGVLTCAAVQLGAKVLAIDLLPQPIAIRHPSIRFQTTDVMSLNESSGFDLIINCSTVEHVGLGGRYGSRDAAEGDLAAMQKLRGSLLPGGLMLLTVPIGLDAVYAPHHRVYGARRLPQLLAGYEVVESMFWRKGADNRWESCSQDCAQGEQGSVRCYALGCMTLRCGKCP